MYFGAYRQVTAVSTISLLRGMLFPKSPPSIPSTQHASIDQILAAIHQASTSARLFSLNDPMLAGPPSKPSSASVPRRLSHRDIITLSTADARVLTIWHYGQNQTAGDCSLWAMHPLHFGTLWGLASKSSGPPASLLPSSRSPD